MRPLLLALLVSLSLASTAPAAEVRISAAASTTDAVTELAAAYAAAHPGVSFTRNFASSGALAKQLAAGAPVDLFISANPKWMDYLTQKKFVPAADVRTFAFNALVFVGESAHPAHGMQDLPSLKRIAIGSPASVPAGQYAKQALTHAGLYEKLLKANKLVMAKDVRQALVYADRGETDGAFVYKTDALLAKKDENSLPGPPEALSPGRLPHGADRGGGEKSRRQELLRLPRDAGAKKVLAKYGFVTE